MAGDAAEFKYATAPVVSELDCVFYHTMEVPGHGLMQGQWDLRTGVDEYLGRVALSGRRVLEIGPASGFLTFEMEKRGAQVVSIEMPDDHAWDFVPYPDSFMEPIRLERRKHLQCLKNAWWLAHAAFHSQAKVCYTDVYGLPEALGRFDVAVIAAVLLHSHSPLKIIEQCARRAKTLVITDLFRSERRADQFVSSS